MIKKYYDPIKGIYTNVLHLGEKHKNMEPIAISVYLEKTIKSRVTKLSDGGFRVIAEDFLFNTQSFVFTEDDYVMFDMKNGKIKVIPSATDELMEFFENNIEL